MTVNRWKDLLERTVWTAIQAGAAVLILELSSDTIEWGHALAATGIAALIAALKVVAAQNVGEHQDGAAIPGGVIDDA